MTETVQSGAAAERKPVVLVVDDERNTRDGLCRALRGRYEAVSAESAAAAIAVLEKRPVDVMLSDVRMPGGDGISLLRQTRERFPDTICILLTAYGSVETAVEAMKSGARDFLTKPINLDQLDLVLERSLRARALESENAALRRRLDDKFGLHGMVGSSPAMESLYEQIRQVAPTRATVLVEGPSGTGKELVARALHDLSQRASGPFVAVHCAALPPSLLESELFGHEKGAFTGADQMRKGRFELARGGTLFLDEIGEIDASVQVKLLRVLETRRFERVGGDETIEADIRVVAATNRDLKARVAQGAFREDLYYRLAVVTLNVPPLSERPDDIPLLCNHFLGKFAEENGRSLKGFEPAAMALLRAYPWPGNVRELRNAVERMVVLSRGDWLTVGDVPENVRDGAGEAAAAPTAPPDPAESLADAEKRKILAALEAAGGNRSKAADALGISRRTIHRKLAAWGMAAAEGAKALVVATGLALALVGGGVSAMAATGAAATSAEARDIAPAIRDGSLFSTPALDSGILSGSRVRWVVPQTQVRVARPMFSVSGLVAVEALADLAEGRVTRLRLSIFNRGDMGRVVDESDFPDLVKRAATAVDAVFGAGAEKFERKTDPTDPGHDVEGMLWKSASAEAMLEWPVRRKGVSYVPVPEWLRLEFSPPGGAVSAAASEAEKAVAARGAAARAQPGRRVKRGADGSVELDGVPMVDQGEKGYCAAATVARIMAWYGLGFLDQHQIAGWAASDPEAGTSSDAMIEGLGRVLHDRYKLVFRKLPGFDWSLLDFVKAYNKAAKKAGMAKVVPEIDHQANTIDGAALLRQFDPALFLKLRSSNPVKVRLFSSDVKGAIDSGVPVVWSVVMGFVEEQPSVRQSFGGHMRLIVGYNERVGTVIYSDSWGAGHERKEMAVGDAVAITRALYTIAPTLN